MAGLILVTGAAGRIGRVVVTALREAGLLVRATDLVAAEGIDRVTDLCDPEAVAALIEGCAAVVHLAGHPNSRDWAVLDRLNICTTRLLLDAAGRAGVERFVYASSVHVVGLAAPDTELTADMPIAPDCPYGVSKAMCEGLLHYYAHHYGMSGVSLRICSFRPHPMNARELRLWISPADMGHLALCAVQAEIEGVATIWGLSNNRRAEVDRTGWAAIGYRPNDDAEAYAEQLRSDGIDTNIVSEWPLLGGAFVVSAEHRVSDPAAVARGAQNVREEKRS